jgi:Arc/MetJ-type ribon-helix-helix transcriptional regulator
MPNSAKTVELAEDLQAFAEERVRAGQSASVGDVVREAVEEKKLAVLREALDVGLAQADAGQVIPGTPAEHMDRIRKRHGMNRTP